MSAVEPLVLSLSKGEQGAFYALRFFTSLRMTLGHAVTMSVVEPLALSLSKGERGRSRQAAL